MLLKVKKIIDLDEIEFIDDCVDTEHIKGYDEYTDNITIIKLNDGEKIYVAHSKEQIIRAKNKKDEDYLIYDFDSENIREKALKEIEIRDKEEDEFYRKFNQEDDDLGWEDINDQGWGDIGSFGF